MQQSIVTAADLANWQFAIFITVVFVLAVVGASRLIEDDLVPAIDRRRRAWRAARAARARVAADPLQDRARRARLDTVVAITSRRTH